MTNLILVDPPVDQKTRLGKFSSVGSFLPSLGLASLAAVARKSGFSVEIIDANLESLTLKDLTSLILKKKPAWVGVSATTLTIEAVGRLASFLKKGNPKITVVVGGAHITAVPKDTLKRYPQIDIGVLGEGEETLAELLNSLRQGSDLVKVKGIAFRKNRQIIVTNPRPFITNLDLLPLPAWDLISGFPEKYKPSANSYLRLPAAHLVTSRGCTGQCIFCDRSIFGRIPRMFSARRVITTIDFLTKNYKIKEIQFFDDNFCLFPERLKQICTYLGKEKREITWSCQARADMLSPEILKMMKKAGCWQIGLGVESGSDKILKILKKRETVALLEKKVGEIVDEGIEVKGFFILGNPGETMETLAETENFILSTPLDYAHTTFFTPYPGSEIFRQAGKYGRFLCRNDDWSKIGEGTIKAIYVPKGLSKKILEKKASDIFRRFYFRPQTIYSKFRKTLFRPRLWGNYLKGFFSIFSFIKK